MNDLEIKLNNICKDKCLEFTQQFQDIIPLIIEIMQSQIPIEYTLIKKEYLLAISNALLISCHTTKDSELYENALKHVTNIINTTQV